MYRSPTTSSASGAFKMGVEGGSVGANREGYVPTRARL
jgi:hypothetical protein